MRRRMVRRDMWIGLTKTADDCGGSNSDVDLSCRRSGWAWADGTAYNYTDWSSDNPEPKHIHAKLWKSTPGWSSARVGLTLPFSCEKKKVIILY